MNSDQPPTVPDSEPSASPRSGIQFWVTVWVGIVIGGALGAYLATGEVDVYIGGMIFVGIVAIPTCLIFAFLTRLFFPHRFSARMAALSGAISGALFPATALFDPSTAIYWKTTFITWGFCALGGGLTGLWLNLRSARRNYSRPSESSKVQTLVVFGVGLVLIFIGLLFLCGGGKYIGDIVGYCAQTFGGGHIWIVAPAFILLIVILAVTKFACRCRPGVRRFWLAAIIFAFLGMVSPVVRYIIFVQYWWPVHDAVQAKIDSLQNRRPETVEPEQWEEAVTWTHNLIGNVYFSPNEFQLPSLKRLNKALDEKLKEPVGLHTLRWIWDKVEAENPDSNYAVRFWDDRVFAEEPICDDSLPRFRSLNKRTWLNLSGLNITNAGLEYLKNLPRLRSLNLENTHITDEGLEHFRDMKELEKLYLKNTKVTQEGVDSLKQILPGCEIIY